MRIGFGNIFRNTWGEDSVIINLREGNSFSAFQIEKREDGQYEMVSIAGTSLKKDISEILPKRLTLQEIVLAYDLWTEKFFSKKTPKEVIMVLEKYSKQPDREI